MSNITGLVFAPILLAPLIKKGLEARQDQMSNGTGWSKFKDRFSKGDDSTTSNDQKFRKPTDTFEQIRDRLKFGSGL
jgi:hypothetical protein